MSARFSPKGLSTATFLPLLLSLPIAAQGQSRDTLRPIQGAAVSGKVSAISPDGKVQITVGGEPQTHRLAELRGIDFAAREVAPVPRQGFVLLRSGARIPATVRAATGRKVTIDSPLTEGQATFRLTHIQAIRFVKVIPENDGGFAKYAAAPKGDKDLVYIKAGEKIVQRSVSVVGFADGEITCLTSSGSERSYGFDRLYGIVMSQSAGFAPDALPRPRALLTMQDGTQIRGKLEKLDQQHCVLTLAEQVKIVALRQRLRSIGIESDRLVFLTDMKPVEVERTPAFRTTDKNVKPWMKNRTALGDGIHLGGNNPRKTDNGLVLRPLTRLTYDIGGNFDFFEATIAIDNRSTGPAHAIFRVRAGDKVLFESKPFTRQSEPLAIKVPVSNVKQLTVEADFGKNFDFGDHCVFAEARVIKRGS